MHINITGLEQMEIKEGERFIKHLAGHRLGLVVNDGERILNHFIMAKGRFGDDHSLCMIQAYRKHESCGALIRAKNRVKSIKESYFKSIPATPQYSSIQQGQTIDLAAV